MCELCPQEREALDKLLHVEAEEAPARSDPSKIVWLSTGEPAGAEESVLRADAWLTRDAVSEFGRVMFAQNVHVVTRWDASTTPFLMDLYTRFDLGGKLTVYFDHSLYHEAHEQLGLLDTQGVNLEVLHDPDSVRQELALAHEVIVIGGGLEVRLDELAASKNSARESFAIASTGGAARAIFLGRAQVASRARVPEKSLQEPGSYAILAEEIFAAF